MARTHYTVELERGYYRTTDAGQAEKYAREGHRVTATTGEV